MMITTLLKETMVSYFFYAYYIRVWLSKKIIDNYPNYRYNDFYVRVEISLNYLTFIYLFLVVKRN